MPVRGLRANHGATAAPPEHRHHPAHREDDRGGEQAPQIAPRHEVVVSDEIFVSLGAVT